MPETTPKLDTVHWRINCQCDVRCSYCYDVEQLHEVQPDSCFPVLDKMIAYGIDTFVVTGGEPLLSKRVDHVLRHLHDHGVRIVLHTNCQFWDFHDDVLRSCVDTVVVPIEGASEKVHDEIRGRDNMRAVMSVLNRYAKPDGPFRVRVGTVVGRHNLNELEAIQYLMKRFAIESWVLYKYPRYTDRTVLKHFREAQLGVSQAEFEAAARRIARVENPATPIRLASDIDASAQNVIMLNPELEVALPSFDQGGVLVDKTVCTASDHSMAEIAALWSSSVDWGRYQSNLRVSL